MQSKISIVVPCYNKANWIGGMLQSVHDQKWDNIELILVNDGSNDGTRQVMAEWEAKLVACGYDVIIVDQDNQGVGAAVRNGMAHISGDYFCTVDCDDILAPEFLAILAGWLEDNPEYDGVSCAYTYGGYRPECNIDWPHSAEDANRLENYILLRMEACVWNYLIRTSYVKRLNILQNYHVLPRCSQEPQLLIPLLGGGGAFKHISKGLYLRNNDASDISKTAGSTLDNATKFLIEYYELIRLSIQNLEKTQRQKERLLAFAEIGFVKTCLVRTSGFPSASARRRQWFEEYLTLLRRYSPDIFGKLRSDISDENFNYLIYFNLVEKLLFREQMYKMPTAPPGKVIGCGALGKHAKILLPMLKKTPYYPSALWDDAAHSTSYYEDTKVVQPDFDMLSEHDILLIFPNSQSLREEIAENLAKKQSKAIMLFQEQIFDFLGSHLFLTHPQ